LEAVQRVKLLLTSSGISNPTIEAALVDLLGKPIAESSALFVPTGIYPFPGGGRYAYLAMKGELGGPLAGLGWQSMGVLELTALSSIDDDAWKPTVAETDALLVWGGDPVFLAYWLRESGLADFLPSLTDTVYVGTSAGAIATAATFAETYSDPPKRRGDMLKTEAIAFDTPRGPISRTLVTAHGMGLVDFAVIPHFDHPDHEDASAANAEKWAAHIPAPTYAIDDQTAIKVVDGEVEVMSEGKWTLFTP
jgi:dipeptidase E